MASSKSTLSATYTSPTNAPFSITKTLPVPAADNIESRTTYLADLRKAVAGIQDEINKELTARMEEDKARDASAKVADVDEAKEEENYGEEVVEEDE
jgi:hypothetical protein